MRVAIRVDASREIGIGHVRRCLSLAQSLQALRADVVFVTRDADDIARSLIEVRGFACRTLTDNAAGAAADAREALRVTVDARVDWWLVDHYSLDARWHEAVRHGSGAWLAAIDDLANRPLAVDLLIDHNIVVDPRAYATRLPARARQLRGPRFALIDPVFAVARRYRPTERVHSLGIFMGGADAAGFSQRVLESCRVHAAFGGPIEIATTSANPHLAAVRAACGRWPQTTLVLDQPDLAAFFARHDLQIGAGGGALWERCCLGAPTLALVCADNQREVVRALVRAGIVATAPSLEPADIGREVAALAADASARRRLHEISLGVVDGHGAERVALAITARCLSLRPAAAEDAAMAFGWRNHANTRAASSQQAPLEWDAHCEWWQRASANPMQRLWIGCCGDRAVGVIRFDLGADGAQVSIYLDPLLTGLGLGARLLAQGLQRLRADSAAPATVTARVRSDNAASQALFRGAGFERVGHDRWLLRLDAIPR